MISRLHWHHLLVAVFLMATANSAFVDKLFQAYPLSQGKGLFVWSVTVLFTLATAWFLSLVCHGRSARWVLALLLVTASVSAYFMDRFGTVIDSEMIRNMTQTDLGEARDLWTVELLLRLLLLGVLPAWLVIYFAPEPLPLKQHGRSLALFTLLAVGSMGALIALDAAQYASFFRANKSIRYYANPTYPVYSLIKFGQKALRKPIDTRLEALRKTSEDAVLVEAMEHETKELVILVVGETARADRFSLNGYKRPTNPELQARGAMSFSQVSACGTSTAISVPCMFSQLKAEEFDVGQALGQTNVLDVLRQQGVEILWRDNNSDSKGVASRVEYEDFKSPDINPVCDLECRDVGMLSGLEKWVDARADKDILIVLHQMGNHGPAYYKRYPAQFEQFKPACQTSELSDCTREEIGNAYDNAILYTDYFLGQVIDFLKKYDQTHETAMLYVSDHGESLGEYGLYLHGAPKAFAPKEQTHVAAAVWMGSQFDYTLNDLQPLQGAQLSHDDLYCALLLGFEVGSSDCFGKDLGAVTVARD